MGLYEEYKPFRRYMRRFDLLSSLVDVWRYSLHMTERQPLPDDYAVGRTGAMLKPMSELIYPWELDTLTRELLLNATRMGTRTLKNWDDLAHAINYVRQLDEVAFVNEGRGRNDAMFELHRLAHRQFRWQTDRGMRPVMRALKVFGEATVESIVVRELGMTMRQFMQLGMAVNGHFLTNWGMSTNQDYEVLGISRQVANSFLRRITCSLEELRLETARRQSYDRDWLYTWNPLEATPLIRVNPAFPDRVLCPIPRYLTMRVSTGIFYDLVKSAGFDNSFGNSFEDYVGMVIKMVYPPPRFTALAEHPYYVGSQKMHGVDWVLSNSTGHLFIECKTKRLTLSAKTLSDHSALEKDLAIMAKAVVQHYRNIRDALDGKTSWVPDGRPSFPLVLTLEDWLIISPQVDEALSRNVRQLLVEAQIPEQFLDEMPYTIASANEFEIAGQVIAQVGISPVMTKKTTPEQRRWLLLPFLNADFKQEMRHVDWHLFDDDRDVLIPKSGG